MGEKVEIRLYYTSERGGWEHWRSNGQGDTDNMKIQLISLLACCVISRRSTDQLNFLWAERLSFQLLERPETELFTEHLKSGLREARGTSLWSENIRLELFLNYAWHESCTLTTDFSYVASVLTLACLPCLVTLTPLIYITYSSVVLPL